MYSTELMEVWNGTPEDHAVKARELVDRGITAVKMLYGTAAEEVDLGRVAAVREAIGPDIATRSARSALGASPLLDALPVLQPLALSATTKRISSVRPA